MSHVDPACSDTNAAPQCILCGKCLEVCPLLAATGREELAPRAKGWLDRYLRQSPGAPAPDALTEEDVARLAGFCLSCGRCAAVCPQGVDVPALVAGLRRDHPTFRHTLWKQWLARADRLWPLAGRLARVLPESLTPGRLGVALKAMRGLSDKAGVKPFVTVAEYPDQWRGREALLFPGCAGTHLAPRWTDRAVRFMEGLGMRRIETGQGAAFGCCGSPLEAAGFAPEAHQARERNVEIWRAAGRPMLLVFCASCLAGLRAYPEKEFQDAAEARAWAASVTPLAALLHPARFVIPTNAPDAVGYHRPCHGRDMGHDPDRALLEGALGGRLVVLPDACCGFGGVLRLTAPDLADQVGAERARGLDGLDAVLTGCTACVTQLATLAPKGTIAAHWLDMLDISGPAHSPASRR